MYSIAEVAKRSGFPPSTLRYYEEIGLLPFVRRTTAGYRNYDDDAVDRLAFIARAKQLGCSLDDITSLVSIWDQRECQPVQTRLRELVSSKIADAEGRVTELTAFIEQLHNSASSLEEHTPNGPCDATCGCTTLSDTTGTPIAITSSGNRADQIAIACTLDHDGIANRQNEWNHVLAFARTRVEIDGGMRIAFGPGAPIEELARLVAAEQSCCSFFSFSLTVDNRGIGLDIEVPADAIDLMHDLIGKPS